jgi:hypothetical protein
LLSDISESDQIDYSPPVNHETAKRTVAGILRDFESDETSIDAELTAHDDRPIGMLDTRKAELELRRDKI